MMTPRIRPETAADAAPVRALLIATFGGTLEAELTERLRRDGEIVTSFVALDPDGAIIGYAAFIRLVVAFDGRDVPVIGFVPLAVTPVLQRLGIGTALVLHGLAVLRDRAEALVFVLGDPAYYGRFGFEVAAARAFECPYAGPNFMALRLREAAPLGGRLRYPSAFTALG